jgi:ATP-dependent Zn protease
MDMPSDAPEVPKAKPPMQSGTAWLDRVRDWFRQVFQLHPDGRKPNKQQLGAHAGYWVAASMAIILLQSWWAATQAVQQIPYSDFRQLVREHKVASVQVSDPHLFGELRTPDPEGRRLFETTAVPEEIAKELENAGVKFTGVVPSTFWSNLLSWLLPTVGFYLLWAFGHSAGGAPSPTSAWVAG